MIKSWQSARELVLSIPGYTPEAELYTLYLASSFTSYLPGEIIEIGSWVGRSAIALADESKVHCIDLFLNKDDWKQNSDGSWSSKSILDNGEILSSHQDPPVPNSVYVNEVAPAYAANPCMLDYFKANVAKAQKQEVIIPYRGTSASWAKSMPADFKCRLAFIDGGHSYKEVCEDIRNIESFLISGALILFDDVYAGFPGIDQAVKEMIIDNPQYTNIHHEIGRMLIARKV